MASGVTERRRGGLWGHPDFLKLWAGQSASLVGAEVTVVAMPFIAIQLLGASAAQIGIMVALARLPSILYLFAGAWTDRTRRRPILIWTDLGRAAMLVTIPVLFLFDALALGWLFVVVFVVGVLRVLFETAYRSYLPSLIGRENLAEGNSKLQLSESVGRSAGPGLAGVLVNAGSAALVIIVDVVSYLFSALACLFIRKREEAPPAEEERSNVLASIWEGMRWVFTQPLLRPVVLSTAFYTFFVTGVMETLYFLFLIRELHLSAGWVGAILAVGGIGAIIGAWVSARIMRHWGPGPVMLWSTIIGNGALLLVPLANGPIWMVIAMLAASQLIVDLFVQVYMVNQLTLQQSLTPDRLQGRVIATMWSVALGLAPVGAVVSGFLAETFGIREVILVSSLIGVIAPVLLLTFSPIRRLRTMPEPATPS
ncbi:MFS transporter [Actinophytocola sp.]|uniref:MFS transporter n=1 Tax=Actinophytocola sp. TaxID=1872138 RepID=UPI003D6C572E